MYNGGDIIKNSEISKQVSAGFADTYVNFKDFCQAEKYRPYWKLCLKSINDRDFLMCCIFCNDTFAIPPVKTFLSYYREDLIHITGDERAQLDIFTKRAIGAFWGMVFKFVLGYTEQKSVSVSMNEYFMVKTASVYSGKNKAALEGGPQR